MQNGERIERNADQNTDELARAIAHLLYAAKGTEGIARTRPPVRRQTVGTVPSLEEQIDLIQLLYALRDKIIYIIICALLGGVLAFGYTTYFVTPLYQASIKMIVNSRVEDLYSNTTKSVSDVTSAQSLVATYATVIKSNRVMEEVVKTLELDMGWRTLNNMVAVRPVESTPVINIIVTGPDPEQCRQIVTAISQISPDLIVEAVQAGSCKVITDADCTGYPISPDVRKNTLMGVMAGAALCAGLVVLLYLLNDSIQSEEQLAELSPMPVLSTIPHAGSKSGSKYYGYSKNYGKKAEKEDE